MEAFRNFLLICVVFCVPCFGRQTDQRWLSQPPRAEVGVIIGGNTTLTWEYQPSGSAESGRLVLSHLADGKDYYNILIEAAIDPITGDATTKVLKEEKVEFHVEGNSVRITLKDMEHDDLGHYQLVISFDGPPIRDSIMVKVFDKPDIVEDPGTEIIRDKDEFATLRYVFNKSESLPDLSRITLTLVPDESKLYAILMQAYVKQDTEQWEIIFPDEQKIFKDRMSVRHNVQSGLMEIVLWNLAVNDTGVLDLTAVYGDELYEVRRKTLLRVVHHGFQWITVPQQTEHAVLSRSMVLIFEARNDTRMDDNDSKIGYRWYKLLQSGTEQEILNLFIINGTETVQKSPKLSGRLTHMYKRNKDSNRLELNITQIMEEDSHQYLLNMYHGDLIVLTKTFQITVLPDRELMPLVKFEGQQLNLSGIIHAVTGHYTFSTPHEELAASLILYTGMRGYDNWTEHCSAYNAKALKTRLTESDILLGVTLEMQYDFYTKSVMLIGRSPSTGASVKPVHDDRCLDASRTYQLVLANLIILILCFLIILFFLCWFKCCKKTRSKFVVDRKGLHRRPNLKSEFDHSLKRTNGTQSGSNNLASAIDKRKTKYPTPVTDGWNEYNSDSVDEHS